MGSSPDSGLGRRGDISVFGWVPDTLCRCRSRPTSRLEDGRDLGRETSCPSFALLEDDFFGYETILKFWCVNDDRLSPTRFSTLIDTHKRGREGSFFFSFGKVFPNPYVAVWGLDPR